MYAREDPAPSARAANKPPADARPPVNPPSESSREGPGPRRLDRVVTSRGDEAAEARALGDQDSAAAAARASEERERGKAGKWEQPEV